jgi:hypothetical protein
MDELLRKVDDLKREVAEMKRNRLYNLSMAEVETIKNALFERTAATLASGASAKYVIVSINGVRKAIPMYDKFTSIV